ncbi:hypothetical protein [Streptomyces sp. NPDC057557]|uniref:hypothetical protein n=1 Tax=Streptomyces sp. NPDC057557 TaxID=3346167 RepID=UPI00367EEC36
MRKFYAMGVMAATDVFTMVSVSSAQAVAHECAESGQSGRGPLRKFDRHVVDVGQLRLGCGLLGRLDMAAHSQDQASELEEL